VQNLVRGAVRRCILQDEEDGYALVALNIAEYARGVLKEQFFACLNGNGWMERSDSIPRCALPILRMRQSTKARFIGSPLVHHGIPFLATVASVGFGCIGSAQARTATMSFFVVRKRLAFSSFEIRARSWLSLVSL
jgi:hypothetical protein